MFLHETTEMKTINQCYVFLEEQTIALQLLKASISIFVQRIIFHSFSSTLRGSNNLKYDSIKTLALKNTFIEITISNFKQKSG